MVDSETIEKDKKNEQEKSVSSDSESEKSAKMEKLEKRILKISLWSGVAFALVEFIMAVLSNSQSILMDAAFDSSELIIIAGSLFLTPLLYKPVTERHPFGYAQCESVFIIVKGFMLISVVVSLIVNNIQILLSGGNHVNMTLVSKLELVLTVFSLLVLLVLRQYGKVVRSPMVNAEISGWKIDVVCGLSVSVAFLVPRFFQNTVLQGLIPYFDQIVAITLAVLMIPEPVKMIIQSMKDLLLFAPDKEIVEDIKSRTEEVLSEYSLDITFMDITQTGRKTWVAVTFRTGKPDIQISMLKTVHTLLMERLSEQFEDIYLELIPAWDEKETKNTLNL